MRVSAAEVYIKDRLVDDDIPGDEHQMDSIGHGVGGGGDDLAPNHGKHASPTGLESLASSKWNFPSIVP